MCAFHSRVRLLNIYIDVFVISSLSNLFWCFTFASYSLNKMIEVGRMGGELKFEIQVFGVGDG